jgi:hypothetical protein
MNSDRTAEELCIRIADVTIGVLSVDPCLRIQLEREIDRFRVSAGTPDLTIKASWSDLAGARGGQKVFDSGGVWQLFEKDDSYWFHFTAPTFGGIPYKLARLNYDFSLGEVFLHRPFFNPDEPVYPLQYPLDEILMLNLLSRKRGVEVHACGIVDSTGDAFLFAGQSGAGKTTMARLWEKERGATILSDDRIILRRDKDRVWMYGTPWHGEAELASPSRAPLKAVYFLRHGFENGLRTRSGAQAAAQLFSCSFPVFYSPEGLQYTLEFYDRLTKAVPCQELSVVPNREVIDYIRMHQINQ